MSSSPYMIHSGDITPTETSPRASSPTLDYNMCLRNSSEQYSNTTMDGFSIVQRSQSASTLRDLKSSDILLLLTPVLVADDPLDSKSGSRRQDPFEAFGRKLSKKHARVRHVPYISSMGLTSTHYAFLREADAIVYVTFQDSGSNRDETPISVLCSTIDTDLRRSKPTISSKPIVHLRYCHDRRRLRADSPREGLVDALYPMEHQCDEAISLLFSYDS